jgi:hypothetical protein
MKPSSVNYLTTPTTQTGTLNFCNAFSGQSVCCNNAGFDEILTNFNDLKTWFETSRTERLNKYTSMKDAVLNSLDSFVTLFSEVMVTTE